MIKISSFYPFASLLRITQEFGEEKARVKVKSLKFEQSFEFEYKDVDEISDRFSSNNSQNNFGFELLGFAAFTSALLVSLFCNFVAAHPVLLRIEQTIYVCGLLLYITSFKKSWYIFMSDRNDNVLTYIKLTRQNRDLLPQVIEKIKSNSQNVREITAADPFPEEKPAFERTYYDASDLEKTTDRFYENEIIGFQKGIFSEMVYSIQYSRLSGKVYRSKLGNEVWGMILTLVTLLISVIGGFFFAFGPSFGITISMNLAYLIWALIALFLISLPIKFIKREAIGLYDKTGNVLYYTYVNKTNKTRVEEIIEFVQSRIPPVTNNELVKEQV